MPSSHVSTAAASTTVHNKPATSSLPSPPVPVLQVPASNPTMEPPPPPIGFPAGQMYPPGFHPQLFSSVTPTSEWVLLFCYSTIVMGRITVNVFHGWNNPRTYLKFKRVKDRGQGCAALAGWLHNMSALDQHIFLLFRDNFLYNFICNYWIEHNACIAIAFICLKNFMESIPQTPRFCGSFCWESCSIHYWERREIACMLCYSEQYFWFLSVKKMSEVYSLRLRQQSEMVLMISA